MKKTAIMLLIILAAGATGAANIMANQTEHYNHDKSNLAIKGYDPVSYYLDQPQKGSKQFETTHDGLLYRFASKENLDAFQADPAKYKPAYGGWCAWAMLEGDKVDINPKRYKIINGLNYLFYDGFFGNTLEKWNEKAETSSEAELVQVADQHWIKINQ